MRTSPDEVCSADDYDLYGLRGPVPLVEPAPARAMYGFCGGCGSRVPPAPLRPFSCPACSCTEEEHEALKRDPARWLVETTPAGLQDDGAGGALELGHCRRCNSTLARPAA